MSVVTPTRASLAAGGEAPEPGKVPTAKAHQPSHRVWTREAVLELGLTTDIETAATILGISRTKAYALAKSNEFPVRLIRAGRRFLVPVPLLLSVLGIGAEA